MLKLMQRHNASIKHMVFKQLSTLTRDWAYWDDMYQYAQKPSLAFEASNMGPEALKNVNLMGVLILSPAGQIVGFKGATLSNGKVLTPDMVLRYRTQVMVPLGAAHSAYTCGYAQPEDALLFMCASRISRSRSFK